MEEKPDINYQSRKKNERKARLKEEMNFEKLVEGIKKLGIEIPVKEIMSLSPKLIKILRGFVVEKSKQDSNMEDLKSIKNF